MSVLRPAGRSVTAPSVSAPRGHRDTAGMPESDVAPLRHQYGNLVPAKLYRGRGCRSCLNTGFRGRRGIFEMMAMTEQIRAMVMEHASSGRIRRVALEQGMGTLRSDGWRLVREGVTTIQEVVFATKDERDLALGGLEEGAHVNGAAEAVAALVHQ